MDNAEPNAEDFVLCVFMCKDLQTEAEIGIILYIGLLCLSMPFGGTDLKQRLVWLVVIISLFMGLFTGCGKPAAVMVQPISGAALPADTGVYGISAAVLYDGTSDGIRWQDTIQMLQQSVLLGLEAETVDVSEAYELSKYDLVIPDAALANSGHTAHLSSALQEFTRQGGFVLLDNAFSQVLPGEYLGISGAEKLNGCPLELTFPALGQDLTAVQEVIADFASLYPEYYEGETLLQKDYGFGFTADTAQVLASLGELAIYTYNAYGQGGVLLTNPLLPNVYSLGNYEMTHREEGETAFASTTASCNQLLYSRFAGFAAKQRFGYALNRIYGYHGSPSLAWELHYEEITAYANNAMKVFDDLCRQNRQIPSYTIIRNSYWWFLRAETVTYLRNQAERGYAFEMDYEESAYSSGTHIVSDGQWLSLGKIEDAGSYFKDYPEYNYRAYPCFADLEGDGEEELLMGSQDGYVYFSDIFFTDRLHASAPQKLTDEQGDPIKVSGFSAPQMADITGDGNLDLIVGANDGNIYWYENAGNYVNKGLLLRTDIPGQVLPSAGDFNGDGIVDLAVGSDQGVLLLYYGQPDDRGVKFDWRAMESYTKVCANADLGHFLAPAMVDWNGDGRTDLAVGTFDGYIALLLDDGEGNLSFDGYVDVEEMNYKGNHHIKFGNYCVPAFFDVDRDGAEDLVCGSLEYGLAYPIDSDYFPYREELQSQLDYARDNYQYLGVHHYSNAFSSRQREDYELRRHKEAFASYGAETANIGANMHTWYTSTLEDTLTFDAEFDAGLLWNSGFSSPGDPGAAPQYAAENVVALPFFLQRDGADTLLVQNNSVLPYADGAWSDISAKYHMPVCVYYHCDFAYVDDAGARDYIQKVSDFQYRYGYNFLREDQMMYASAAARNLDIQAEYRDSVLTLRPDEISASGSLWDPVAQRAVGLEVEFAENVDGNSYHTDAKVWHREGNSLLLSLGDGVTISQERSTQSPLRQVNLPANIAVVEDMVTIEFLDDGMLQVIAEAGYTTEDAGWTVTEQGTSTVFTKYGSADTLHLRKIKE